MQWGGAGAGLVSWDPRHGPWGFLLPLLPVSPSCTHHTQEARIPQAPPCPKQEEMQFGASWASGER